jgi:hypothetical protein
MVDPAADITVFDGMVALAGVPPARVAAAKRSVPRVEGVVSSPPAPRPAYEDRADLSPGARDALARDVRPATTGANRNDDGTGRLIDVLA